MLSLAHEMDLLTESMIPSEMRSLLNRLDLLTRDDTEFTTMRQSVGDLQRQLEHQLSSVAQKLCLDVQVKDDCYVIHADVPGFEKENIHISVTDNILTIETKRELETHQGAEPTKDRGGQEKERKEVEIQHQKPKGKESQPEEKSEVYFIRERYCGDFTRKLRLPNDAIRDFSKFCATFKNGVLTLVIPRVQPEKRQTHCIEIQ